MDELNSKDLNISTSISGPVLQYGDEICKSDRKIKQLDMMDFNYDIKWNPDKKIGLKKTI